MGKILVKVSFVLALLFVSLNFCGCSATDADSDSISTEKVLYPDNGLAYKLIPNDKANNDSVSANLAHGAVLLVHPRATYTLSFEADTSMPAPQLQLFRLYVNSGGLNYTAKKVKTVTGTLVDGRYSYTFECHENDFTLWAATLLQRGTYYTGTTNKVRLTGVGAFSNHMSLNLIVTGNVAGKVSGFTIDELAQRLLANYRTYYTSVVIDTLYVSYANEHPTLGKKYPANEPWIAGRSSQDVMVSELGGWPGIEDALDLVLVHYIDEYGVLGYSNLFSGNMGGGDGSTVVLGAFVKGRQGQITLEMSDIIETALHESGHFFGLRHSTASSADLSAYMDYSNYEDGLDDTPYCENLLKSGMVKTAPSVGTDFRMRHGGLRKIRMAAAGIVKYDPEMCPDAGNYMFPLDSDVEELTFSEQQLDMIRSTLMIYPH